MAKIDKFFSIALIGDENSEKTSWVKKLKSIEDDNGDKTNGNSIDITTGKGRFRFIFHEYEIENYKNKPSNITHDFIFVMIDITNQKSYDSAFEFLDWTKTSDRGVKMIFNKCDSKKNHVFYPGPFTSYTFSFVLIDSETETNLRVPLDYFIL